MAELFERHDRSRFEIIGVSFGVDDGSEMRRRLVAAFDQFHDVREKSDHEVAKLLHDRQVDIAIDLKGYTQDSRSGILAYRPAPIQVSYLGYPGTMGAPVHRLHHRRRDRCCRSSISRSIPRRSCTCRTAIRSTTPSARSPSARRRGRKSGCRSTASCSARFNNNWKITPEVFDVWMRLLHQVEGSVLWLLRDNEGAERNLRKEAQQRGIDPARLVFADRLPPEEHLARHRLADLFLDTLPYNAHTTASDALWAGLPVLTCMGDAFAGRVAASLLHAVGLPELVTANLDDYEALALKLARDPALLAEIKAKLAHNRDTCAVVRPRPLHPPHRGGLHDDVGDVAARRRSEAQRRRGWSARCSGA